MKLDELYEHAVYLLARKDYSNGEMRRAFCCIAKSHPVMKRGFVVHNSAVSGIVRSAEGYGLKGSSMIIQKSLNQAVILWGGIKE